MGRVSKIILCCGAVMLFDMVFVVSLFGYRQYVISAISLVASVISSILLYHQVIKIDKEIEEL